MPLLPQDKKERQYMLLGLRIIGDFGAIIALPVVMFVLVGQYLDEKYATGWKFTALGFILAVPLSGIMIFKKAKAYGEEYKKLDDK